MDSMLRWVLVGSMFVVGSSLGCSSSTDDGGKEAGNTAGTSNGSAGSTNNAFVSCADTHCPNEFTAATSEDFCDILERSACYEKYTTWAQCRISHEKCTEEGKIDQSTITACDAANKAAQECAAEEVM